ncbi:MAG: VPS10 domain-containing protein [Bryobacteraceae bacterium]
MSRLISSAVLLTVGLCLPLSAQSADPFANIEWRFIGPANMGGRATDIEGVPGNPDIVYAGYGGSGLWKTSNGGHSWTPIFEKQSVYSIGDLALEPGNPDVIWVGTGESNTRNSVSFGDGVYKSTDGGKTWKHMGLRETERISRVLVHPTDPNTVYIGALGHSFGPNDNRGVYMTTDGGKTWQRTLHIDNQHGVADMDIDAANPNTLFAAMWKFERKPWTHTSGSEQGGIFRSIDGGRTWEKLSKGLPKLMGRIGVKSAPSNPKVVYVIAECKQGTLFRSGDGGDSFKKVSDKREIVSRGFYYSDLRIDPRDENKVYAVASTLFVSIDGGKEFKPIVNGTHIDYHSLWIDPKNPKRLWCANDGGIAQSNDGGATWRPIYQMPVGQFYQVYADNRLPFYWVMGGLQDNGSWAGPSATKEPAGILSDDWRMVQFGDGFYMMNHPDNPDLYLAESQGGSIARTDMRTREQQESSVQPLSPAGGPASAAKYRFNWNSPIVPSPHDKNTVYFAGNVLFRSRDFGKTWQSISPDLTTNDKEKQKPAGGPVWFDNSTAEYHSTIISVAESPRKPGQIWVGADDGRLHVSEDAGASWKELTARVGVPKFSPVSHVEPSRVSDRTAYAAFDRHMFDDFAAYVFKTADGGDTWTRISGDLPAAAYVHALREDPRNPSLLYAGTELGLYATSNGGRNWIPLKLKNLPPVAVHDIVVHPRENDLILATHGRSIAILDDAAFVQQMTPEIAARELHLFEPRPGIRHVRRMTRYGLGGAVFKGANPPYGALITYSLKDKLDEKAELKLEILDEKGALIREVKKLPREKGVNRVAWDLKGEPPAERKPPTPEEVEFGGGSKGVEVLPGTYRVRLVHGAKSVQTRVDVRVDPTVTVSSADLKLRFEYGTKLRNLLDAGNRLLRALDSLKEQLDTTRKLAQDRLPEKEKEIGKLIDGYTKDLEAAVKNIGNAFDAQRLEVAPALVDQLADLFSSIEAVNAAPTAYQMEALASISPAFTQGMAEINEFLRTRVPEWSGALQKAGAPGLVVGDTTGPRK